MKTKETEGSTKRQEIKKMETRSETKRKDWDN